MNNSIEERLYQQMIKDINTLLGNICDNERMRYHIIPVVNNAKVLAKEYKGDLQVVELSAYLHDITRILEGKEKHHITGAIFAEEFLRKYHISNSKIELIKKCIYNHRGSTNLNRDSIEEKIIATADAMAHIQYPLPLFYTWYGKRKASLEIGAKEIADKLRRSWQKIEFVSVKKELERQYEFLREVLLHE